MDKKFFYAFAIAALLVLSGCTISGVSSTPSTGGQGSSLHDSSLQNFICSRDVASSEFYRDHHYERSLLRLICP